MSTHAPDVDVFLLLVASFDPPLAGWYATPLSPPRAAELRVQARRTEQQALASAGDATLPRLAHLIAGYWLGQAMELDYRSLAATLPPERQALVELIYGQLLISRKRAGALDHLRRGFALAAPALAPADYFALLRRHELLQSLVLSAPGSASLGLADLLNEARIVRQFGTGRGSRPGHKDDDTLG
jgi:hypothetical protein